MRSELPRGWVEVALGDLVSVEHGYAFKSEFFCDPDDGVPIVVGVGNFEYSGGFRFQSTQLKGYSGDFPDRFALRPGDILLVMTCQTQGGEILGIPGRIPGDGHLYLHNQRLGRVVIRDADRLDAGFAYWLFLHPDFNQHLCRTASGSKILHTAPSRIEEYRLALPPIEDQRRVASVLGALDDKIQSNRRLTTLLSETSGTLFAYLDAPVTKTIPLGEVVDVIDCLHSRKPERRSDGKLLLQLDNVREDGLLDLGSQFLVSDADYANWTRRIELREGDCVITNVGRVGAVARVPNVRGALGRNMTGLRCRSDWPFPAVLIEALISPRTRRAIEELTDAGTVMNALNVRNIPRLPLPMLSRDLLEQAEASLSTTWRVRESLLREGQTLGRLRDALLPKLISGQIPVPDSDDPEEVIGPPAGPVAVGQS